MFPENLGACPSPWLEVLHTVAWIYRVPALSGYSQSEKVTGKSGKYKVLFEPVIN
jgi:hypothetical protein